MQKDRKMFCFKQQMYMCLRFQGICIDMWDSHEECSMSWGNGLEIWPIVSNFASFVRNFLMSNTIVTCWQQSKYFT